MPCCLLPLAVPCYAALFSTSHALLHPPVCILLPSLLPCACCLHRLPATCVPCYLLPALHVTCLPVTCPPAQGGRSLLANSPGPSPLDTPAISQALWDQAVTLGLAPLHILIDSGMSLANIQQVLSLSNLHLDASRAAAMQAEAAAAAAAAAEGEGGRVAEELPSEAAPASAPAASTGLLLQGEASREGVREAGGGPVSTWRGSSGGCSAGRSSVASPPAHDGGAGGGSRGGHSPVAQDIPAEFRAIRMSTSCASAGSSRSQPSNSVADGGSSNRSAVGRGPGSFPGPSLPCKLNPVSITLPAGHSVGPSAAELRLKALTLTRHRQLNPVVGPSLVAGQDGPSAAAAAARTAVRRSSFNSGSGRLSRKASGSLALTGGESRRSSDAGSLLFPGGGGGGRRSSDVGSLLLAGGGMGGRRSSDAGSYRDLGSVAEGGRSHRSSLDVVEGGGGGGRQQGGLAPSPGEGEGGGGRGGGGPPSYPHPHRASTSGERHPAFPLPPASPLPPGRPPASPRPHNVMYSPHSPAPPSPAPPARAHALSLIALTLPGSRTHSDSSEPTITPQGPTSEVSGGAGSSGLGGLLMLHTTRDLFRPPNSPTLLQPLPPASPLGLRPFASVGGATGLVRSTSGGGGLGLDASLTPGSELIPVTPRRGVGGIVRRSSMSSRDGSWAAAQQQQQQPDTLPVQSSASPRLGSRSISGGLCHNPATSSLSPLPPFKHRLPANEEPGNATASATAMPTSAGSVRPGSVGMSGSRSGGSLLPQLGGLPEMRFTPFQRAPGLAPRKSSYA